jgi:uncharacterized protein (TIGR01777 family)
MKNVLITGGSGLVGTQIRELFESNGYTCAVLSRSKNKRKYKTYYWDYTKNEIDKEAIEFADIIIHLAGENISEGRWTLKKKEAILNSRVITTNLLYNTIKESSNKPNSFLSASATGYYGIKTSDTIFTEDMPADSDFLATTGKLWEDSANNISLLKIRSIILRIGIVLSNKGGALSKMSNIVQKGIGAAIGSGKQYMPWIHIDDLAKMFLFFAENEQFSGIYNAVSPEHVTNEAFMNTLAVSMNKKIKLPNVPAFVMKMLYGEMATLLLEGSRVSAQKVIDAGFEFKFKKLDFALEDLL